jgi:ATP-dependent Clp protease ATP-binding subunit ClpA
VIQEHIKQPLADEVLFGKLQKGGTVKITVKDGGEGLSLEALEDGPVKPKPEPTPKPKRPRRRKPVQAVAKKPPAPKPPSGGTRGLVPKVPLKTN